MLRQTARNLDNWNVASLFPLDQKRNKEDGTRDASNNNNNNNNNEYHFHNVSHVMSGDDNESWTNHNNSWEEQQVEAPLGFNSSSTSSTNGVAVMETSHISAKLREVGMMVTVAMVILLVLWAGVFLQCERRRMRLEQEAQAAQEARHNQQEQAAQKEKIRAKLKLVEFGKTNMNFNNMSESGAMTESDTWSETVSSFDGGKSHSLKDSANNYDEESANESDSERLAAQEETESTTAVHVHVQGPEPETTDNDKGNLGGDDDEHCCYICLTPFEEQELVSASNNNECQHVFHKECIEAWLLKQDGCPVCRRNYLEDDNDGECSV